MSTPRRDDHDPEADPTGVRALLSSLPDPGPMPEDLVARITSSLVQEQRLRRDREAGLVRDDQDVVSLDAERQRRRPARVLSMLGAAAAVAVAATVATTQLFGSSPDSLDVSAQYGVETGDAGAQDDRQQDGAGQGEAAQEDSAGGAGDDGSVTGDGGGAEAPVLGSAPEIHAVPSVVELSRAAFSSTLRAEVDSWVGAAPGGPAPASEDEGVDADDGQLPGDGAEACAQSVPEALVPGSQLFVAPAALDGEQAVLLVQTRPAPVTAWVLPATCVRGPVELLHGPVTLD